MKSAKSELLLGWRTMYQFPHIVACCRNRIVYTTSRYRWVNS